MLGYITNAGGNIKMDYTLDLVTAPALEPVSVAEVKNALRVEHTDDDTLIGYLITAARTNAEAYTRRAFITQTWKMFMDNFSGYTNGYPWWGGTQDIPVSALNVYNSIEIPMAPLQSITHLKTYDDADVATTFSSSNYFVSTKSGDFAQPGSLTLREAGTWPIVYRVKDGVEIQFVAGYGTNATDVPQQIRMAIQEETTFLYNNRSSCDSKILNSTIARALLAQFRIMKL